MPECPSMTFTMDHEVSSTLFTVACPAVRPSGPCMLTCADRGYPARRGRGGAEGGSGQREGGADGGSTCGACAERAEAAGMAAAAHLLALSKSTARFMPCCALHTARSMLRMPCCALRMSSTRQLWQPQGV